MAFRCHVEQLNKSKNERISEKAAEKRADDVAFGAGDRARRRRRRERDGGSKDGTTIELPKFIGGSSRGLHAHAVNTLSNYSESNYDLWLAQNTKKGER